VDIIKEKNKLREKILNHIEKHGIKYTMEKAGLKVHGKFIQHIKSDGVTLDYLHKVFLKIKE